MKKIFLISLLLTSCFLSHHEQTHDKPDEETSTHYHPDPKLQDIKGLEYCDDNTNPDESFWSSDKFKYISEKLGFKNKPTLNTTDIMGFLFYIAGYEGDQDKIPQGIKEIFDKFLTGVDKTFNTNELKDKLNITKLFNSIKEYNTESNQQSYYDQVKEMFNNTWQSVEGMFKNMLNLESPKEDNTLIEKFTKVLGKLGLKDQEAFQKKDISKILHRLFINDKDTRSEYPKAVKQIFEKFLENFPENLKLEELKKYLNYEKFIEIIKTTTRNNFGEEYLNKFKDVLESKNITEIFSKIFNFTLGHEEL